jgi:integrase
MAIGKPRGKNGMRPVYVYDPARKAKAYVGSSKNLRGPGGAQELEREWQHKFAQQKADAKRNPGETKVETIAAYRTQWLDLHHGENTRRPAKTTWAHNETMTRGFVAEYGHLPIDGGIDRRAALGWARKNPTAARCVSAMFNDAVDDMACKGNPFANRRQEQSRERKDIHPLTDAEVDRLATLALEHWGADGYGLVARAWVLFAAWVGCRPGETFSVTAQDLDFANGQVRVRRVKKRGKTHPTDLIVFPRVAQDAIRAISNLPTSGPIFTTVTGRKMVKGSLRYHWDPVRAAFRTTVTPERWAELLDNQRDLDFYVLRHVAASRMADAGLSEHDIAHQLGNSPEVCRETYVHVYQQRTNDRVRLALEGGSVVDLASKRRTG